MVARKYQLVLAAGLVVLAAGFSLLALRRVRAANNYSQTYSVRTHAGTNYLAQITATTIGRTDTGYLVTLQLRLQNPHPEPLRLSRDWFLLVDHDKDYFQPTTTGAQPAWITIPAHGVAENERFTFAVPADSLDGALAVQLGQNYWIMIKTPDSPVPPLRAGEFISFQRRDW